jgi:hypothetical protein
VFDGRLLPVQFFNDASKYTQDAGAGFGWKAAQGGQEIGFPLFEQSTALRRWRWLGAGPFGQNLKETDGGAAGLDGAVGSDDLAQRAGGDAKLAGGLGLAPAGFLEEVSELLFCVCVHILEDAVENRPGKTAGSIAGLSDELIGR